MAVAVATPDTNIAQFILVPINLLAPRSLWGIICEVPTIFDFGGINPPAGEATEIVIFG